jgi:hypothetical protein
MSLKLLMKVLLIKEISLLSKALGKEGPFLFPNTGTLWKQTTISTALLGISFGVPRRGAPSMFPTQSSHREGNSTYIALLHPSLKVSGKRASFKAPKRGPYGERCPPPEPSSTYSSGSLAKEPPLSFP